MSGHLRGAAWHKAQELRKAKREAEREELESFRCTCGHRAIDHPDARPASAQTFPCSVIGCSCRRFFDASEEEEK